MIAIINYGLGNLHSVQKAIAHVGSAAEVTDDPRAILRADKVILPGVGAFADGMKGLQSRGLVPVVQEVAAMGLPLLGICLGMQLLFEESEEQGQHLGLSLLSGKVVLFQQPGFKVPQIGWNQVEVCKSSGLMNGIRDGDYFYLQDKELAPILKSLEGVVEAFGEKNGYTLILDSKAGVIFFTEAVDISDQLVKDLDAAMAAK